MSHNLIAQHLMESQGKPTVLITLDRDGSISILANTNQDSSISNLLSAAVENIEHGNYTKEKLGNIEPEAEYENAYTDEPCGECFGCLLEGNFNSDNNAPYNTAPPTIISLLSDFFAFMAASSDMQAEAQDEPKVFTTDFVLVDDEDLVRDLDITDIDELTSDQKLELIKQLLN